MDSRLRGNDNRDSVGCRGKGLQTPIVVGSGWVDCLVTDWQGMGSERMVREARATPKISPNGLPIIALPYLELMKLRSARTQDLSDVSRMMGGANPNEIAQVKQTICEYLPGALEDLESLIILGQLERITPN